MPLITEHNYNPNFFVKNGHINTLFPYIWRKKPSIPFNRERINTPDHDFFDVDWWKIENNDKLVILLHGLEGSSSSQYINGMARLMHLNQYSVAAINFRSCSGEMNLNQEMYHSGFTKDLHHFLQLKSTNYHSIYICGFSLGGNVVMKYAGDQKYTLSEKIKAIAGISVPCDLKGGSYMLKKWYNYIYEQRFLATLLEKVKMKQQLMPEKIDISNIHRVKSLWDFDDYFTAGLHGFENAEDYYKQCSSLQFLSNITIPSLMINALDDTFLPDSAYPVHIAENSHFLHLSTPKHGGHVGFTTFGSPFYWNEMKVLHFFNKNSN